MEGFYGFFCEVQFLCHEGTPNWLGWVVIAFIAVPIANLIFGIVFDKIFKVNN